MIKFKDPLLKVRCLECKESNFIEMKYVTTDKDDRSIGLEYSHLFRGELKCSNCGESMQLITTIYEFPKGFLNYHNTDMRSCSILEPITEDSLKIYDDIQKDELSNTGLVSFQDIESFYYEMGEDWHLWDTSEKGPYPISRVFDAMKKFIDFHRPNNVYSPDISEQLMKKIVSWTDGGISTGLNED